MYIFSRRLRLPLVVLLGLSLIYLLAGTALAHTAVPAHAKVYKAIPAIGSTIAKPPTSVTVFTLENINPDPKKSNLWVYDPAGELISQGNATVSLSNPREMSIPIKPDPKNSNGVYIVRWITVSAEDGDPDQGAFFFTVQPHAALATSPAGGGSGGLPLWVPILVGVLALLAGFGAGWIVKQGQRTRPSTLGGMRRAIEAQEKQKESSSRHTS